MTATDLYYITVAIFIGLMIGCGIGFVAAAARRFREFPRWSKGGVL